MAVEGRIVERAAPQPAAYDGRITAILRKRRRPLLLVLDEHNELLCSSLPDVEQTRLSHALAEARSLAQFDASGTEVVKQLIIEKPGERCALVTLAGELHTVRLFPLYAASGARERFAALLEPVGGPFAEGIDFAKVKEKFRLSNREVDVLAVLMSGSKDKEIARALGVSAGTVRAYLKSVRAKLRVTTRAALVNRVHELSSNDSA
jgi:DNA-binding CsgD family transcriptional regulator